MCRLNLEWQPEMKNEGDNICQNLSIRVSFMVILFGQSFKVKLLSVTLI